MTNATTVLYELTDHTVRITLNRPDKLNAINTEMREGLAEALRRFESEEDAWIGVFAGAGGNFSVGLDLSEADRKVSMMRRRSRSKICTWHCPAFGNPLSRLWTGTASRREAA